MLDDHSGAVRGEAAPQLRSIASAFSRSCVSSSSRTRSGEVGVEQFGQPHHGLRGAGTVRGAGPTTCQLQAEAIGYCSPPIAQIVTGIPGAQPESYSLAAICDGIGIITAAKPCDTLPGTIVLRVHQPTNAAQTIGLALAGGTPVSVEAINALEDQLDEGAAPEVTTALNTVRIRT